MTAPTTGRRAGDLNGHPPARVDLIRALLHRRYQRPPDEPAGQRIAVAILDALRADPDDTTRLRALVTEVVTAAWTAKVPHHPEWLTDDLWARLVAETPKPDEYADRPSPAEDPGLF